MNLQVGFLKIKALCRVPDPEKLFSLSRRQELGRELAVWTGVSLGLPSKMKVDGSGSCLKKNGVLGCVSIWSSWPLKYQ